MPVAEVTLPALHATQRQVIAEAKRFNALCCGRRWGKSTLGIDRIVKPALEGFPCAWFAPNYKTLLEIWRSLQETLAPVIVSRNNAEFRFWMVPKARLALPKPRAFARRRTAPS